MERFSEEQWKVLERYFIKKDCVFMKKVLPRERIICTRRRKPRGYSHCADCCTGEYAGYLSEQKYEEIIENFLNKAEVKEKHYSRRDFIRNGGVI